eukprot:6341367-Pyramimonas_sp.AAC.1
MGPKGPSRGAEQMEPEPDLLGIALDLCLASTLRPTGETKRYRYRYPPDLSLGAFCPGFRGESS